MKLGEQWIDGQNHMVKTVAPIELCKGCCFNCNQGGCCWEGFDSCQMGNYFIIKDLGILNEDGCLPCPLCGKYPDIKDGGNVILNYVICHNSHIVKTIYYPTIQQAIDAWNRRS